MLQLNRKFGRRAALLATATLCGVGAATLPSSARAAKAAAARHADGTDNASFEVLKKAQETLLSRKSYRAITETTDDSGKTTERTVEVVPPKSYHIKTDRMEMIILPEGSYQQTHGHWMRMPMDMSRMMGDITARIFDESSDHITVKPLGPTVREGVPALLYDVSYSNKGATSESRVWLRATDKLILHSEGTVDMPKKSFMGHSYGGKMKVVTNYDYTTPVKITPPDI